MTSTAGTPGVEVVPLQREHLAAPQPVEHAESERDRPPVILGCLEESVGIVRGPGDDVLLLHRLGDGARQPDTCRGRACDESFVDRGAEHGATDLHATSRQLAACGERFDPRGDVIAVERCERDRAETGLDVPGRPLLLLLCLLCDVGERCHVSLDEPADRVAGSRLLLDAERAGSGVRRSL